MLEQNIADRADGPGKVMGPTVRHMASKVFEGFPRLWREEEGRLAVLVGSVGIRARSQERLAEVGKAVEGGRVEDAHALCILLVGVGSGLNKESSHLCTPCLHGSP